MTFFILLQGSNSCGCARTVEFPTDTECPTLKASDNGGRIDSSNLFRVTYCSDSGEKVCGQARDRIGNLVAGDVALRAPRSV